MNNNKTHFAGRSSTKEEVKDLWRTPGEFFNKINNEFDFDLDACASNDNFLLDNYLSIEKSCLENEWSRVNGLRVRAVFINPPYSQTSVFLERAAEQAKAQNITVVALVNANTDTRWFKLAASSANEIRLISGRIGFVNQGGLKVNGNTKGQCLIIWRGNCVTPCNITMMNR